MPNFNLRLVLQLLFAAYFYSVPDVIGQSSSNISIDHIPIVVRDLALAKKEFNNLGFTIKAGRLHENTINNAHLKFQDGSALELITASEPRDDLAQFYINFLANDEGPAFISLEVETPDQFEKQLSTYNLTKTEGSYYIWYTFPKNHPLSYFFFIHYKQVVKDEPKHLHHSNTAVGIGSITLTKADFSEEVRFFAKLGFETKESGNDPSIRHISIGKARLIMNETHSPSTHNRPIAALSIQVEDIGKAREQVADMQSFSVTDDHVISLSRSNLYNLELTFVQN